MMNSLIKKKKIMIIFFTFIIMFTISLLLAFWVLGRDNHVFANTPTTTYIVNKNDDGINYDINTSAGAVIATKIEWGEVVSQIAQSSLAIGETKINIQLGNGTDVLDIGNNSLELSDGEYDITGKLKSSTASQGVVVRQNTVATINADIQSVNEYGILSFGTLIVKGGTIISNKETIRSNTSIIISGNPSFETIANGVSMIRTDVGNAIIDGGYVGNTVINMFIDGLTVNSPDPATFIIVKKTEGVSAPDVNKWRLLNQNFDLLSSTFDDSNGSLISKKYYNINYIVKSNLPPVYLNGYTPIEKAYPGDNIKLPTRCDISLTGDISYYSLHGWYEVFDGSQPDPYIGTPITEINNISSNRTVYAKFSDTPPSQPPCPVPTAPLEYTYDTGQNGYIIVGMNRVAASNLSESIKNNLTITIPAFFDNGVNGLLPVVAIAENALKASEYVGYTFTSLIFENGCNLISIGASAFEGCDALKGRELIIPNKIISIGERAFYNAGKGYTGSLIIPPSMQEIGSYAFYNYNGRNGTLQLAANMTMQQIFDYTFYGCNFSGNLVIPNSVIHINDFAFSSSRYYNGRLILPINIETIGNSAFASTGNFYGTLVFPNSIKSIGAAALSTESRFNTIYLPNNENTVYGDRIFGNLHSDLIIIAANKSLYDTYKSTSNNLSVYTTLTYETVVTFFENGGNFPLSSAKVQAKLFGYKLCYEKDANSIWTINNSYALPISIKNGYTLLKYQSNDGSHISRDTIVSHNPTYTASWVIDSPIINISTNSFNKVYRPSTVFTLQLQVSNAVNGLTYVYEWYRNGVKIPNATKSTHNISIVADSGNYTVKVKVFDNEGMESDWVLSAAKSFIITRATIDTINSISFTDKVIKEDGKIHNLEIYGNLPQGVNVSYTGTNGYVQSGVSAVGIYTVTAKFTVYDTENYNTPRDMIATLTINIAEITAGTSDGKTSITISGEKGLNPATTISIEEKAVGEHEDDSVIISNKKHSFLQIVDIKLLIDGVVSQLDSPITVRLLIKENLRGYDNLDILYIMPNGTVEKINATRDGDYFVFNTSINNISLYAISSTENALGLGAIIGIIAGVLGVSLILIAVTLLYLKNKKRKSSL